MKDKPIIVFDFGGVLVDWNPRHLYRKLFDGDEAAMEAFLDEVDFYGWNHQQDLGRPFSEGVAELSEQYPHRAELIAAYADRWDESISGPIDGTVEILRVLKERGYPLYGLTNWAAETFYRIQPKHDFLNWFSDIVVSGDEGLAKPDPAIYHLLLQRAKATAEECLLIDDSAANIAAADELGLMTIHFQSPIQLSDELSRRGVL